MRERERVRERKRQTKGTLSLQMRGDGKKYSVMQKIEIKTIKIHSHSSIMDCEILKITIYIGITFYSKDL